MTILSMLEVLIAVVLLAAGVFLYRSKPAKEEGAAEDVDHYGSQGAVLLFVIAIIMIVHGFGALEYRPSASELEAAKAMAEMGHRK
jgi:ABC-type nickel/cobalt efflux system permease component RcnA